MSIIYIYIYKYLYFLMCLFILDFPFICLGFLLAFLQVHLQRDNVKDETHGGTCHLALASITLQIRHGTLGNRRRASRVGSNTRWSGYCATNANAVVKQLASEPSEICSARWLQMSTRGQNLTLRPELNAIQLQRNFDVVIKFHGQSKY